MFIVHVLDNLIGLKKKKIVKLLVFTEIKIYSSINQSINQNNFLKAECKHMKFYVVRRLLKAILLNFKR